MHFDGFWPFFAAGKIAFAFDKQPCQQNSFKKIHRDQQEEETGLWLEMESEV